MKYKMWLLMLNISNSQKIKLLLKYGNESSVYQNYYYDIMSANEYDNNQTLIKAENSLDWIKKNNINIITIGDDEYPDSLRNIPDPPYGLFYKGNINLLKDRIIAIIGSRNCSQYGIEVTKLLTKEIISYNITIISGGAKGIDSVAHKTVLESGKNTIVVLGCGIDVCYPSQNRSLFNKIEEVGLILSEFPPGTKPYSYNFPRRNRIISGLSEAVIVTEASKKSGSLITAGYALDQGKDVLVVPGSIFSSGYSGCNLLIKEGAIMITSLEDLRSELKLQKYNDIVQSSPVNQKILSLLKKEPVHIDELVNKSYIDREDLFKVLFEMQIRNEIVFLPGDYYAKII